MSATIETEKFANFFKTENVNFNQNSTKIISFNLKIIYLEGRCHPIEVFYSKKSHPDYLVCYLFNKIINKDKLMY